jgi:heptosyltransferase-2
LEDSPVIGVQFEAGASAKEWPEENSRRFLALAAQKLGNRKLVFVGTDEQRFAWVDHFIKDHAALGWVNLIGKTSVRELLYCIRHFSAFVGLDSGPTHVAVSFGMPVLFLYSGTNEFERWKSLGESADFLRNPVPCSPCHELQCPVAGHPCMTGIAPERVIDWLLERSRDRR